MEQGPTPARTRRADAARNRERLIEAAKAGVAELGASVSLEEIARRAELGIGTLYRHFPTREALLEAVYHQAVDQLAASAPRLLSERPAVEALDAWMRLFVDYVAAKRVVAEALAARPGGATALYAASGQRIVAAVSLLMEAAATRGEIRPEVTPADLMRALIGLSHGYGEPGWDASARRLVEVLMDGLRAGRA